MRAGESEVLRCAAWGLECWRSYYLTSFSPATTKNTRIPAEATVAFTAIRLFMRSSYLLVTAINTGTLPLPDKRLAKHSPEDFTGYWKRWEG